MVKKEKKTKEQQEEQVQTTTTTPTPSKVVTEETEVVAISTTNKKGTHSHHLQQHHHRVTSVKNEIEGLRNQMEKLFQATVADEEMGLGFNEGMMGPFHTFDEFGFWSDPIFGPSRHSPFPVVHECMTDAHQMLGYAIEVLKSFESSVAANAKAKQQQEEEGAAVQQEEEEEGKTEDDHHNNTKLINHQKGQQQQHHQLQHHKHKHVNQIIPQSKIVDRGSHYLATIRLPFAGIEDVRFRHEIVNDDYVLVVYGTQHLSDELVEEFEVKFTFPKIADVKKSRATFHGEVLCVSVPKLTRSRPALNSENFYHQSHQQQQQQQIPPAHHLSDRQNQYWRKGGWGF